MELQTSGILRRVQWGEFFICLVIIAIPIVSLALYFNFYPKKGNALIMVSVIFTSIGLGIAYIVLQKKNFVIEIKEGSLFIKNVDNWKVINKINFREEHSFAIALRQGIIGKSAKTVQRWLQIFALQGKSRIRIESRILETQDIGVIATPDVIKKIKGISNPLMNELTNKKYVYNEPCYLALKVSPGYAAFGLSSFYLIKDEEFIKKIIKLAEKYEDKNRFLKIKNGVRMKEVSFRQFKKHFFRKNQYY